MKKRIQLHDSKLVDVKFSELELTLFFDPFVILNITDQFGFEFDNSDYGKGEIVLKNPLHSTIPKAGIIFDGHILSGENRLDLIPPNLKIKSPCALVFSQESGEYVIIADEIEFRVSL